MLITCERARTGETILAAWTPCALTNGGVKRYVSGIGLVRRVGSGTPIPMSVDLLSPFDPMRARAIAHEVRSELVEAYEAIATRHPWIHRAAHTSEGGVMTVPAWQAVPEAAFMSTQPTSEVPAPTRVVLMRDGAVVGDEVFLAMRTADAFVRWFRRREGTNQVGGAALLRADKPLDAFAHLERAIIPGTRRAFGAWCRAQQIPVAQSA